MAPNIYGVLHWVPFEVKITRHNDSVVTLWLVRQTVDYFNT